MSAETQKIPVYELGSLPSKHIYRLIESSNLPLLLVSKPIQEFSYPITSEGNCELFRSLVTDFGSIPNFIMGFSILNLFKGIQQSLIIRVFS